MQPEEVLEQLRRRTADWPSGALDDFIVLMAWSAGVEFESLTGSAQVRVQQFLQRSGMAGVDGEARQAALAAYLNETFPLSDVETLLTGLRELLAQSAGERSPKAAALLGTDVANRPVEGTAASASSLFQLRLKKDGQ
jgi:hypothetical protein